MRKDSNRLQLLIMDKLSKLASDLKKIIRKHPVWFMFISTIFLVAVASIIFYSRYPYAFHDSNFYAEDGTIFARNIYIHGVIRSALIRFNGYLIIGLYGLEDIALLINHFFGNGFMTMAKSLALTSYIFLGFICSLPWLLFRKKLGSLLALITVLILTIFPLGAGDYAVIGEIGNLKLAFFFVSALLVLYRIDPSLCKRKWQFILVDIALLICVLTNFLSIVLLPLALIRYKDEFVFLWQKHRLPKLSLQHFSLIALGLISFAYACAISVKGIPPLLNYPLVVGPVHTSAVFPLFYRASAFGILFAISNSPSLIDILLLIGLLTVIAWRSRERRIIALLVLMIIINYLGFLLSRPGVTTLYLIGPNSADAIMFFYAGTLIFIFAVAYSLRHWFNKLKLVNKVAFAACALMFFLLAYPSAGDRQGSYDFYKGIPTLHAAVVTACAIPNQSIMHINVYPVAGQVVVLPHHFVCDYRR